MFNGQKSVRTPEYLAYSGFELQSDYPPPEFFTFIMAFNIVHKFEGCLDELSVVIFGLSFKKFVKKRTLSRIAFSVAPPQSCPF